MHREDYILREISKIGDFILGLMGKLNKQKPSATINNEFKEISGIDFNEILNTPNDELLDLFQKNPAFTLENIELIADFFAQIEELDSKKKAYSIYQIASELDTAFSINRNWKMEQTKSEIEEWLS